MINFSKLQSLSIPEGNVTKIQDASGMVLWSAGEEVVEVPNDCIVFVGETSNFTLTATYVEWDGIVQYSTDKTSWEEWDGTEISSVNRKLYLRGSNNTFYTENGANFILSERAACYGNLNTLLNYINPPTELDNNIYYDGSSKKNNQNCFRSMFQGCTNLTQAPELPATELANYCYSSMFQGCTNLTQAPELPATELNMACYQHMFFGCTSLVKAQSLPNTGTALPLCYAFMFSNCTNLKTIPAILSTELMDGCFMSMFMFTNIKLFATQTEEYTQPYRIPASGTGTLDKTFGEDTTMSMFAQMDEETGVLDETAIHTPEINTTYYLHKDITIV